MRNKLRIDKIKHNNITYETTLQVTFVYLNKDTINNDRTYCINKPNNSP